MAIDARRRRCPSVDRASANQMRRVVAAALAVFAVAVSATTAFGWSEETHQTTGAIAWADLKARHPDALAELVTIAEAHQDYRVFAPVAAKLSPVLRERALFEWLARWPDDIRTGPEDHPKWHYELRVVHGWTGVWPFYNGTASEGFAFNYGILADPCAPAPARAKAIGWLIHIVGDIQQPLHAGHQMTADFPITDHAGKYAFVRRTPGGEVTDLHQYWDKIIERGGAALPRGETNWATALGHMWPRQRLPELARSGDPQHLFASYMDETATLARLVAYQGTFLKAAPDAAAAPVLTPRENAIALSLAERRIATSGYRIADTLANAIAAAKASRKACVR